MGMLVEQQCQTDIEIAQITFFLSFFSDRVIVQREAVLIADTMFDRGSPH